MTQNAQAAITGLYASFASARRPVRIEACPCCVDEKSLCTLLGKELRAITPDEMSSYASAVFLTVGAIEDFHYFLPRILEILATEPGWWPDPEVVGRALGTYGWDQFQSREQESLAAFFDVVVDGFISTPDVDGHRLDSWLCCSSYIIPNWEKYLDCVEHTTRALLGLYEWHATALARGRLTNGFWADSPKKDVFTQWLMKLVQTGAVNAAYGL